MRRMRTTRDHEIKERTRKREGEGGMQEDYIIEEKKRKVWKEQREEKERKRQRRQIKEIPERGRK